MKIDDDDDDDDDDNTGILHVFEMWIEISQLDHCISLCIVLIG